MTYELPPSPPMSPWDVHALRDTFAAAALTGLLAYDSGDLWLFTDTANEAPQYADAAYVLADAMLARRDQPAPTPLSSAPSQAAGGPQTQQQPQ